MKRGKKTKGGAVVLVVVLVGLALGGLGLLGAWIFGAGGDGGKKGSSGGGSVVGQAEDAMRAVQEELGDVRDEVVEAYEAAKREAWEFLGFGDDDKEDEEDEG